MPITPAQRAAIEAHVDEVVADAPPLRTEQEDRLRRILHPGSNLRRPEPPADA